MGEQARLTVLRYLLEKNDWLAPEVSTASAFGYTYRELADLLKASPGEEIADLTFLATNGYLEARHADKVHLCPECTHYQLNFREVCPTCQSSDIAPTVHIHHFSCGYVGPETEFRQGLDFICPKCNKTLRHIGIDYEEPSAPFVCNDCGAVFADADVSCVCTNCGARFDVQNAVKHHLMQYRITPQGANAVELGALRESENKLYDPDFPVYNKVALNDHLRQLFNNSIRYDTDLTALQMQFQLPNAQAAHVGPNDLNSWLRQVILRLRGSVRNADIVGMTAADRLTILMPGTGAAGVGPVCEKIEQALVQSDRQQFLTDAVTVTFHPTVFSPDMKYPEQMLEETSEPPRQLKV